MKLEHYGVLLTSETMPINSYITAGNRDGWWQTQGAAHSFAPNVVALSIQYVGGAIPSTVDSFLVYTPNIPTKATINSAYVTFRAYSFTQGIRTCEIYGVNHPNPSIPLSWNDCENAPLTASIYWAIPFTTPHQYFTSPDISPIIRQIINQTGYSKLSNIILQFRVIPGTLGTKNMWAYDGNPNNAAVLTVDYAYKGKILISDAKSPIDIAIGDRPIRP